MAKHPISSISQARPRITPPRAPRSKRGRTCWWKSRCALRLPKFDAIAELARRKNRVLMCVHNWKYAPAYALARRMIDQGKLGAPRFISLDRIRVEPAGAQRSGGAWRSATDSEAAF